MRTSCCAAELQRARKCHAHVRRIYLQLRRQRCQPLQYQTSSSVAVSVTRAVLPYSTASATIQGHTGAADTHLGLSRDLSFRAGYQPEAEVVIVFVSGRHALSR